jgi:hypothetical protein
MITKRNQAYSVKLTTRGSFNKKAASPLIFWLVLEVTQPPHTNPMIIATTAPHLVF